MNSGEIIRPDECVGAEDSLGMCQFDVLTNQGILMDNPDGALLRELKRSYGYSCENIGEADAKCHKLFRCVVRACGATIESPDTSPSASITSI